MTDYFEGHTPRECGEHRTVGEHRAWCHDCSEWCYPNSPCARCELAKLRGTAYTDEQFRRATDAVARCFAEDAEVAPTRSREFFNEIAHQVLTAALGAKQ